MAKVMISLPDDVLAERRAKMEARERPWQPVDRQRLYPAICEYGARLLRDAFAAADHNGTGIGTANAVLFVPILFGFDHHMAFLTEEIGNETIELGMREP